MAYRWKLDEENKDLGVRSVEEMRKDFIQTFFNLFLTEGAVTMESGNIFPYFTILTEKADPLLRRWLAPWSTL